MQFVAGLHFLNTHRGVWSLLLLSIAPFLLVGWMNLLEPILVGEVLQLGQAAFGLVDAALGVGIAAGGWAVDQAIRRRGHYVYPAYGFSVVGLAIVAFALVSDLRLAIALNLVVGFTHAGIGVYYGTELQQQTPGDLRGRVGAVSRIASMTVNPASLLALGWLVKLLSVRVALIAVGACVIGMTPGALLLQRTGVIRPSVAIDAEQH